MIPLKLTIEGLYSYRERQIIDFERLTQAGLFGIFGVVGSGKSAILEAIFFVLYGKSDRLKGDRQSYNMMNLRSNSFYIELDFLNHQNIKYKAVREYRRNSKKFEEVTPKTVGLYQEKNDKWIVLEDTKAEDILDLSYENFKRTIIIPQGQFKEFLELGVKDRTNMMKEIFKLERFDLQENTRKLFFENKTQLDILEGKLSGLDDINPEVLENLLKQIEEEKKQLVLLEKEKEESEKSLHILNRQWETYQALQENIKNFGKLDEQKAEIKHLEIKIEKYEKTQALFGGLIRDESRFYTDKKTKKETFSTKEKDFKGLSEEFSKTEKLLTGLKPKFENLENERAKIRELEAIIQIKKWQTETTILNQRSEKGIKMLEEERKLKDILKSEGDRIQEKLKTLRGKRINMTTLTEIADWFNTQKSLNQNLASKKTEKEALLQKIRDESQKIKDFPEAEPEIFAEKSKELNNLKANLSNQEKQLLLEEKFVTHAHDLHEGEACPLCGSLEHPHKASHTDIEENLIQIKEKIESVEEKINQLNARKIRADTLLSTQKAFTDQLAPINAELKSIQTAQEQHQTSFHWKDFDPTNPSLFESRKKEALETDNRIRELEEELDKNRKNREDNREKTEKYNEALEKFRIEKTRLETSIHNQSNSLKILNLSNYNNVNSGDISLEIQELSSSFLQIETDYKKTELRFNQLNLELTGIKAELKSLSEQLSELDANINKLNIDIFQKIKTHDFESKEQITDILSQELNPGQERKKIQDFYIEWEKLNSKIRDQKEHLKDFAADKEKHEKERLKVQNLNAAFMDLSKKTAQTEAERVRIEKTLKEKQEFLKKQIRLTKRAENLNTLSALFRGQGFVQYISSIYLRQLCDHANVRFHKMTHNQLSLQLNENLDFEIIDYLNEGKSRSVKTLSGGQSFQVALSLALALAESVPSNVKADKNFFFIDEGFGTQDEGSAAIVFDTLMQLRKENRIVGIISHVDSLKDRVPISLQITKDKEGESHIGLSF